MVHNAFTPFLSLVAFLSLLVACSTPNLRPDRPAEDLLQLGKTTESQVIASMGEPHSEQYENKSGKKIKYLGYSYMSGSAYEQASFRFYDGVLVGHNFSSSFPDRSTDFDLEKVESIVKNKSTRQDVEKALGKPSGEQIYPLMPNPEGRLLIYQIVTAAESKAVVFVLDNNDTVLSFSGGVETLDYVTSWVLVDQRKSAFIMFTGIPEDTDEATLTEIRSEVSTEEKVNMLTWEQFTDKMDSYVQAMVIKNDYPNFSVADGLVCLVGSAPGAPWGLTWNGGIALTDNDYLHAIERYQAYKSNPDAYSPISDPRADPVNPGGHLPAFGCM